METPLLAFNQKETPIKAKKPRYNMLLIRSATLVRDEHSYIDTSLSNRLSNTMTHEVFGINNVM